MRLGIFGGSFDPVHRGHLLLADCCAAQADLDQIWFVPTAHQPLKPNGGPTATDAHRLAMLQLACADQPKLKVSSLEIDRGGISYTVDTLKAIRAEQPDAEALFFARSRLPGRFSSLASPHRHLPSCHLAGRPPCRNLKNPTSTSSARSSRPNTSTKSATSKSRCPQPPSAAQPSASKSPPRATGKIA